MSYKDKYHKYLKSNTWLNIKLDLIKIRDEKCERCSTETKRLHLHHLTYKRLFNEEPEEPEDLELLCGGCHMVDHGISKPKKKSVKIDKTGRDAIKSLRAKLKAKTISCEDYARKVLWIRQGA